VIPTTEWTTVLTEKLDLPVHSPASNLPLFFVDSEGMGLRGDAFDFMTTSPPAIIAKVCRIRDGLLLWHKLQSYLHLVCYLDWN
jgi:hypothetical protein